MYERKLTAEYCIDAYRVYIVSGRRFLLPVMIVILSFLSMSERASRNCFTVY